MDRREVLAALGATAAGLAAGAGASAQARQAERRGRGEHDEHAKMAARTCSECADECDAGFHHCHEQLVAGKKDHADANDRRQVSWNGAFRRKSRSQKRRAPRAPPIPPPNRLPLMRKTRLDKEMRPGLINPGPPFGSGR